MYWWSTGFLSNYLFTYWCWLIHQSYKKNLENVRGAIKELGKYELRKFELNRQKKLLALSKDENSKKRLKKLERFTTTNDYDFTHVLIADYGVRLLQVAPLLAYYDVDPNIVGFIGTGAWDDAIFFNEPTLQNAIFPGVEYKKRQNWTPIKTVRCQRDYPNGLVRSRSFWWYLHAVWIERERCQKDHAQ